MERGRARMTSAMTSRTMSRERAAAYVILAFVVGILGSSLVTAAVIEHPEPSIKIVTPVAGAVTSRSFAVQMVTHGIGVHDSVWLLEDTGGPDYFPMRAQEV